MDVQIFAHGILLVAACVFYTLSSAQENLALDKPATQSSDHHGHVAHNAVDGVKGHDILTGATCSHTDPEDHPWWKVDLGQPHTIRSVRIYNRQENPQLGGCPDCQKRLHGFQIKIGEQVCHTDTSGNVDLPLIIDVQCGPPNTGRYLTISIPRHESLALCEVEVYDVLFPTTASSPTTESAEMSTPSVTSGETRASSEMLSHTLTTPYTHETTPATSVLSGETRTSGEMLSHTVTTPYTDVTTSTTSVLSGETRTSGEMLSHTVTTPNTDVTTPSISRNTSLCYCKRAACKNTLSTEEKKDFTSRIVESLVIDTKHVSRERRRYESVQDDRPSSQMMGGLGIAMMVLVFGSIVMSDIVSLLYYIWTKYFKARKQQRQEDGSAILSDRHI